MLKPFMTERLAIRQLEMQDAPELARISDTPAISQWMSFMDGGFPLEKAEALIASQNDTKKYVFAVRLPDGTLIGGHGDARLPGWDDRDWVLVGCRVPRPRLCVGGTAGDVGSNRGPS
jgi:RimJ/RimL family protein N-acetyltransferase